MSYIFSQTNILYKDHLSPNLLQQISPIISRIHLDFYDQVIESRIVDAVVALGISWKNPIHPHADYVKVYLDESVQEANTLQKQLLTQLEQNTSPSSDRFIYSLMNDQSNIISLLESSGYELIRKTYEPTLTVEDCLTHLTIPVHSTILNYRQAFKDSSLKAELLYLLKRNYVNTHQVNPAADMTLSEWESLLLDAQPDLDLSLVGLTNGSISSYITVFSMDNTSFEIAWMGMSDPNPSSYLELKQLFKSQLKLMAAKGIQNVEPEIDTTDHYVFSLFSFLTFDEMDSFDTYRKLI